MGYFQSSPLPENLRRRVLEASRLAEEFEIWPLKFFVKGTGERGVPASSLWGDLSTNTWRGRNQDPTKYDGNNRSHFPSHDALLEASECACSLEVEKLSTRRMSLTSPA